MFINHLHASLAPALIDLSLIKSSSACVSVANVLIATTTGNWNLCAMFSKCCSRLTRPFSNNSKFSSTYSFGRTEPETTDGPPP